MLLHNLTSDCGVWFYSSKCLELVCCLHTFLDPSHHGHARNWMQQAANAVSVPEDLVESLAMMPQKGLEFCSSVGLTGDLDDVDGFIECLSRMSTVEFVFRLLQQHLPLSAIRRAYEEGGPDRLPARVRRVGLSPLINVRQLAHNAPVIQDALCKVLTEFRLALLEFADGQGEFYRTVATKMADSLLKASGPRNARGGRHCVIVSWFASPHSLEWWDLHRHFVVPDWQAAVLGEQNERVGRLQSTVSALADANRLKILRELSRARSSGNALAPALGLARATMSHHLDVLLAAGLVVREDGADGLYYSTDLTAVDTVVKEVQDYLKYNPGRY